MMDYKQVFKELTLTEAETFLLKEHCQELLAIKIENLPSQQERNHECEQLIEQFYQRYGRYPKDLILQKLSDYILLDYIKQMYKMDEENQFHSARQERKRNKREVPIQQEIIDHLQAKQKYRIAIKKNTKELEEQ